MDAADMVDNFLIDGGNAEIFTLEGLLTLTDSKTAALILPLCQVKPLFILDQIKHDKYALAACLSYPKEGRLPYLVAIMAKCGVVKEVAQEVPRHLLSDEEYDFCMRLTYSTV